MKVFLFVFSFIRIIPLGGAPAGGPSVAPSYHQPRGSARRCIFPASEGTRRVRGRGRGGQVREATLRLVFRRSFVFYETFFFLLSLSLYPKNQTSGAVAPARGRGKSMVTRLSSLAHSGHCLGEPAPLARRLVGLLWRKLRRVPAGRAASAGIFSSVLK